MSDDQDIELHARKSDPDTSKESMDAFDRARMGHAADVVVELYRRHGPMADYQLRPLFAQAWNAPCSRHLYQQARSVARDKGRIRDSGSRVKNPESGRRQILWEAAEGPPPEIHRCPTCGRITGRKDAPTFELTP